MATPAATIEIRGRFDDRRMERDIRKSLSRIERSAGKINFNKATRSLKPLGTGLSKATAQADEFTKSLEASNARVLAFGASAGAFYAVGTAIKEMVAQTIEVEKRLAMINVLMGQTSSRLKEFGHSLFTVAKNTGQTFDTVATAANELVRQGLDMNTTLKRTKDAMVLVRMSGMDAKLAVDSLTAAINGFNEAGLDSTRVVNVMANVAANFAVSETDLAEAIRRSGSTAKEAGVSFKQLTAIVTAAQQRTARGGAVIGNAFKSIFTKIHRPRTLDALEAVGIKTRDASGQLESSLKILENMAKAYDTLSDSQRSQITQLMGGLYQVNILKAAVRDLSDNYSLYDNALKVANKTTDEATQRNTKLNLTLSAMINKVVEGSKEMAAMIGTMALGEGMGGLFKALDKVISAITNLKSDSGWTKVIKGVFEGLGAFLSGPGLAIGVALIGKLAITFGRFLTTSVASILQLNTGARNHAGLQKIITAELAAQPGLVKALAAAGLSNLQIQRQVLTMLGAQGTQLAANAKFAAQAATMGVRGGMFLKGGVPTSPRIRAQGHIPNFNKQDTMAESVGAALGGYKPGQIKSMDMPGLGKVTYNTAEKVSSVPGFSQPFISPPKNSEAGISHRKEAMSQTGIDPYTLAEGFVPNFMVMPNVLARHARESLRRQSREPIQDIKFRKFNKWERDWEGPGSAYYINNLPAKQRYQYEKGLLRRRQRATDEISDLQAMMPVPNLGSMIRGRPVLKTSKTKDGFSGSFNSLRADAGLPTFPMKWAETRFDFKGPELGRLQKMDHLKAYDFMKKRVLTQNPNARAQQTHLENKIAKLEADPELNLQMFRGMGSKPTLSQDAVIGSARLFRPLWDREGMGVGQLRGHGGIGPGASRRYNQGADPLSMAKMKRNPTPSSRRDWEEEMANFRRGRNYSGGFVPNFMVGSMAQRMSAKKAAFRKEHGAGAPTQQYLADWGWRNKNQVEWLRYIQKQRGSKNLDFTKLSNDYASFIPHQHQFKGLLATDKKLALDNVLAASGRKWGEMKTSPGLTKAMENRFDGFVPNFNMAALSMWAKTAKPKDLTLIGRGAEGAAWRTPMPSSKFLGEYGKENFKRKDWLQPMVTKSPIDMKAVDVLKGLRQGTKGTYDNITKNDPMMAMRLDALAFEGAVTKAAAKSGIPVEPLVGHAPAAGIVKKLVTPLHKTSLGEMGMLDSQFIGELSEAMVVKGLTGKSSKFLANDLMKADNYSVRNVEKFEKAFLEGASAKSMVDQGLVRILDAGGLQPIISSANFTKYFQKHGAGSKERDPIAIREYLQRAEGDYKMADFIGLGSQKTGVRFVSGGHVPNFGLGQMFSQYMKFGGGQGGRIRKQLAESVPRRENMWTNPDHGFRGLDLKGFLGIPKQSKVKIAEWLGASKKLSVDEKIGRYDRYMNLAARGAGKKSINSYMSQGSMPGWQRHYAGASGGFIPSFSKDPLERSIRGEKLGIQMSGRGGEAKVGYDSRVGVGVYTSHQGSLSNAINQHLSAGQPRSTLGRTGMGLQGAASNAKGHVPNFFEGTDAAGGGMGIGMLAFAFMGMGENAETASKKLLQNTLLDEQNKLKEARDNRRTTRAAYMNEQSRHAQATSNLAAEKVAKAKPLGFGADPTAPRPGSNVAVLERELAKLNASTAAAAAAYDKATKAHREKGGTVRDAKANLASHGQIINPQTGKAYKSKGAERFHRGGAMMQKMGLPLAFMGPMIGGMFAAGMPGTSKHERAKKAETQAWGTAAGYTGIGAMMGSMYTGAAWGMGGGGPAGAAIGAAVGLTAGGLMALTAGTDAYMKVLPELAASSELASAALKDFQNGTSGFMRALGDYSDALRDKTGRLTPQDLKDRRDVMMTAMGNIPDSARGKIIATMNDPKRMNAVMSKEQLRLAADAESKSLAASMGKMQDERRGGFWGTSFFESSNWSRAFTGGDSKQDSHRDAARQAARATGKSADDPWYAETSDWSNPLMRTVEGMEKLDQFTGKYVQTLDLGGKSTAELTQLMKDMDSVFDSTTGMAGYTQKGIMDIFGKLGGDVTAIRNSTLADAQYIASAYQEKVQALILDAEMTKLLTRSINSQKDAADRAREALQRMEDVMQSVYMKTGNAVNALTRSSGTAEDVRGLRSAGKRNFAMTEMNLGADLLKPFLGPESSQRLEDSIKVSQILGRHTGVLESIDRGIRKDLLKNIASEFGKSSTNMSKAFQSAVRGDRSKLESYLTKAGQTRPQANALARLVDMVGDQMKQGTSTDDLLKFVQNKLNTPGSGLSAITGDNTVLQNLLEAIRVSSEGSNASLLKANEQLGQQLKLNELQGQYAQELIRIQKTLSYQGGIQSYTKGTHSGLLAIDSLTAETQRAPRSISPTISEGIASFKGADMFKNFFGAENIPKNLMGDAIAGRASQMAQTAREYEIQTGTELPGWMKDMGSEGTIEAATNQVQASLKDAVPAKLEEVRSQILKLQETIVSENVTTMDKMQTQFRTATENVFGTGATNITGGGRGTILSLIEQQAKLFTMQVDQKKVLDFQVDTQAHSTKADSSRLKLLQESNSMMSAFRNLVMGTKHSARTGTGLTQQEFVTGALGGARVVDAQAASVGGVPTSMTDIQELYAERLNEIEDWLSKYWTKVGDGPKEHPYKGMNVQDAMQKFAAKQKDKYIDSGEDFEDLALSSVEEGAFMGRIMHGAETIDAFVNEMFTSGGYQGLVDEYNQSVSDLRTINADRMTAETNLIQSINDFANQYGQRMLPRTVGLGPVQTTYPNTAPITPPVVRHSGGILESMGLTARGTDVVPAMLTPGEFIVNAKTTKKNRAFLEALNSGDVLYSAQGGYANQYPDSNTNPWTQRQARGSYAPATDLPTGYFMSPTNARQRSTMGYGGEGKTPWQTEQITPKVIKDFKDGVDTFVKGLKDKAYPSDTHKLRPGNALKALEDAIAKNTNTGAEDVIAELRVQQTKWQTAGQTKWATQEGNKATDLQSIVRAAAKMNLSLSEFKTLWLSQASKAVPSRLDPANQVVPTQPSWVKPIEDSLGELPTSLSKMEKKYREFSERLEKISKELKELRVKRIAAGGNPAMTGPLDLKQRKLLTEQALIQQRQGPLQSGIARERARPGEVTDYSKRVKEARTRRKEGMRNLLGDIYGRYERPSQDEAKDALQDKWGTEGFGKPTRREIENYRLENSQWKGMTSLGDSFINQRSQQPMIGDYTNQMNKAVSHGLADKFEASGLDLSDFMKGEGLTMTSAQKDHGLQSIIKRELVQHDSGKYVPLSPEKKKAMVDQERKEAAQMMRGEIFFRRLDDGSGMTEKRNVDAAGRRAGYWGIGGQATGDIAMDSYEMKQNIKDRPEVQKKVEGIKKTIGSLDKTIARLETEEYVTGRPEDSEELKKLKHDKLKLQQQRDMHETFLKTQTPEALKKLETDYDTQWNKRASASGLNKDEMLTDEFGNKLAPHKMAEYLDQPKFKGTLDMGKLSQEYDKYAGSMDRSFNVMQNLKTATEFRTKVQQRFARVAKEAAKNGLSVNATMSAMANEMKKVALDMKLAKGEISGRTARAGNQQYYQGKVNDGTYGMGDMGGQFTSHFIRNAKDDMQDLKDLIDSTAIGMRDGFKKAFKEFAFGTKSSKEAFRDLAMDITSNIFSKMLDFSSENFMSYLMGQRHASGGLVKGYANGGRVTGGTGPRSDDVPMFGSGGEYVIRADSAKRIGYDNLEKLNSLKGYSRGGGISAVLRNQIDFDNPEQPEKMIKNIDPMFSILGQENQSNPQNKERFEREEAFYSHRKSEYEREKANAEKMKAFREKKKQMIKSGWMSAAMSLVSAGAAQWGDTNAIGKFLNSTGGKTLVSAGIGGAFGGTKGAIAGGISGLGAGLLGKWQKEDDAKKALEFEKDLSEMMAKPSFQKQLALQKERQGLNTTGAPDELHMWGAQNVPQEFKNVYKDRARLSKIESELHDLNPAFRNPNRQATKAKGFWEGLRGGASKIGKGIKDTPGALWKGAKAPFGADFWGNPGMDLFTNPFRRQARGGLVRRALGGIVSNPTGQFQEMSRSFSSSETMDTGSNAMTVDGTSSLMGGLGMVKDSGMYSNGGGMRNFGLDNILARVSKGEFIFSPKSTSYLGADALDRLNRGDIQGFMDLSNLGNMKGYAEGGYVGAGLPSLSTGGDSGGGSNSFDVVNQNLVKLIDSVDGVRDSIEQDSGEDSPNRSSSGGSKGTREIANNISITVNIDKNGEVSGRSENDSQEGSGGKGDGDEKDQDRKDKDKNKALGQMMEMEILKVITEQKRPGGLLDDKANSR